MTGRMRGVARAIPVQGDAMTRLNAGCVQSRIVAARLLSATGAAVLAEENVRRDALIEAARKEPPLTVYHSTGKIVDMAKAFSKKYGVQAAAIKVSAAAQFEQIIREAQ